MELGFAAWSRLHATHNAATPSRSKFRVARLPALCVGFVTSYYQRHRRHRLVRHLHGHPVRHRLRHAHLRLSTFAGIILRSSPAGWAGRLGRDVAKHPGSDAQLRRIFICECEAWAVLFMVRALIPRCKHCRLMVRVDNLPVVHMLQKLSCRSRDCLPIIREI